MLSVLPWSQLLAFTSKNSQSCFWGSHMASAQWSYLDISLVTLEKHPSWGISSWSCMSLSTEGRDPSRKHIWIALPRFQRYAKEHGLITGGQPKVTHSAQAPALQHTPVSFILQTAALKSAGYSTLCHVGYLSSASHCMQTSHFHMQRLASAWTNPSPPPRRLAVHA